MQDKNGDDYLALPIFKGGTNGGAVGLVDLIRFLPLESAPVNNLNFCAT